MRATQNTILALDSYHPSTHYIQRSALFLLPGSNHLSKNQLHNYLCQCVSTVISLSLMNVSSNILFNPPPPPPIFFSSHFCCVFVFLFVPDPIALTEMHVHMCGCGWVWRGAGCVCGGGGGGEIKESVSSLTPNNSNIHYYYIIR